MHTFWMKCDLATKSLWKSAIEYGILSIGETNKTKQRKPGEAVMQRLKPLNELYWGRLLENE